MTDTDSGAAPAKPPHGGVRCREPGATGTSKHGTVLSCDMAKDGNYRWQRKFPRSKGGTRRRAPLVDAVVLTPSQLAGRPELDSPKYQEIGNVYLDELRRQPNRAAGDAYLSGLGQGYIKAIQEDLGMGRDRGGVKGRSRVDKHRLILDAVFGPEPPTFDQQSQATSPPVTYEGGTYQRLPGTPARFRVIASDGRDISDTMPVAAFGNPDQHPEEARAALRMYNMDHARRTADASSSWRRALGKVSGRFRLDTGLLEGFGTLPPDRRDDVRDALAGWKNDIHDTSWGVEPAVNAAMRGVAPHTAKTARHEAALREAFNHSHLEEAMTVHRGVGNGHHILPGDWETRDLTGIEWNVPQFTPTSADKDVADGYIGDREARGFGMNIALAQGQPAIAMPDAVGGLDNEGELILPDHLTYRIVRDLGFNADGRRWFDVEIVSES